MILWVTRDMLITDHSYRDVHYLTGARLICLIAPYIIQAQIHKSLQ
jgi:hypothetical protein